MSADNAIVAAIVSGMFMAAAKLWDRWEKRRVEARVRAAEQAQDGQLSAIEYRRLMDADDREIRAWLLEQWRELRAENTQNRKRLIAAEDEIAADRRQHEEERRRDHAALRRLKERLDEVIELLRQWEIWGAEVRRRIPDEVAGDLPEPPPISVTRDPTTRTRSDDGE